VLKAAAGSLSRAFEEEAFAFYGKTLSGRTELLPRWKRMLEAADRALGEDLGQLYVQQAFSPEAKAQVKEMIRFHKEALRQSIQRSAWMGKTTQQEALRKLDTMREKIGYPDRWRDYSRLEVKRRPHVLNVLAANDFEFRRRMAKLGRPVDRNEWLMSPQTNNAYYEPALNEICLPAGILQPPFFDAKADAASNYGALASTIGHEILHGFDDQGSQYDADGNLKNWWTPEDRKAYDAMTDIVVRQYDAYEPLPGLKIRGRQTLGENLADIGGLKISYDAWRLATQGKPQPSSQGFNPEQRFFLAFAQGWRTNLRPEYLRTMIQSDVHSPIRERVLGPVSSLPEFQLAFGCGPGDAMTAKGERQFRIW
jgi:predicted metalloendopeptidase